MRLFNKPLVRRHAGELVISPEVHSRASKVIDNWAQLLRSGDLETTKETSVQGQFLIRIFEECLGYSTQSAGPREFTLTQELSIGSDSADAGLGFYSASAADTRVVVELKDAKTDLDRKQLGRDRKESPVEQGYRYAAKLDSVRWIIVSNFSEIRLYSKFRSQEYFESFSLLDLQDPGEFARFYFLLSRITLLSRGRSEIDGLLVRSLGLSQDITNSFYVKYGEAREKMLEGVALDNPNIGRIQILEKVQLILDRFIFIFFAEDSTVRLLPSNTVDGIVQAAKASFEAREDEIWTQCKGLFKAIDSGNPNRRPPINGYNGGLFASDSELENLRVRDEILEPLLELRRYDFQSDLDVNVLGHIFEQSVADLERIKSQLLGATVDKSRSRRKREGIYYTPEYVTNYIVQATIDRYLQEHPDRLESLAVLDPACGSGAFLNQAHKHLKLLYSIKREELEFEAQEKAADLPAARRSRAHQTPSLLTEGEGERLEVRRDLSHEWAYANDAMLLRHLFGVDLNAESIEITKLSLWLKTAQATKPLRNLDGNLRVGNSLISDGNVSPDAFDWEKQFASVMQRGGFDIIIGNPPYVQLSRITHVSAELRNYLITRYKTSGGRLNTFIFFILLSLDLLREGGYLGFIVPNTLLTQEYYAEARRFLLERSDIVEIVEYPETPFEDATVENVTLILRRARAPERPHFAVTEQRPTRVDEIKKLDPIRFMVEAKHVFSLRGDHVTEFVDSVRDTFTIGSEFNVNQAIALKGDRSLSLHHHPQGDNYYKVLDGRHISRYGLAWGGDWLEHRLDRIHSCKRKDLFLVDKKLLFRRTGTSLIATLDTDRYFALNTLVVITPKSDKALAVEALLAIFNSRLLNRYYQGKYKSTKTVFSEIQARTVAQLPIPSQAHEIESAFVELCRMATTAKRSLDSKVSSTAAYLSASYGITVAAGRRAVSADDWTLVESGLHALSVGERQRVWVYFSDCAAEIATLRREFSRMDEEIDSAVFDLYQIPTALRNDILSEKSAATAETDSVAL